MAGAQRYNVTEGKLAWGLVSVVLMLLFLNVSYLAYKVVKRIRKRLRQRKAAARLNSVLVQR